jgi:hypothetical protein
MKTIFAFLTWATLAGVAFADEEVVGRYQLLSGMLTLTGKSVTADQHVILRIDTKTGKTWSYISGQDKEGKYKEFWAQIPE